MTIRKRINIQSPDLNADTPLMLKELEAAKYIGVSVSYLRKARCQGALRHETPAPPFVRVDGLTSRQVIG